MFMLVFIGLAAAGFLIHLARDRQPRTRARLLELAARWWFGIVIGAAGLFAAMGHLVFADRVAESIGWAPGSPFQREVGVANLAFGLLGIVAVRARGSFREATALGVGVFLLGAAIGHVIEMVETGNTAAYNAGPILYTDVLVPVVGIALLIALRRAEATAPGHARAPSAEPAT